MPSKPLPPSPDNTLPLAGVHRFVFRDPDSGAITRERTYHNIICVNGKNFIAQFLNCEAVTLSTGTIFGAVGTSGTAPVVGDTQLGAEIARATVGSNSRSANVVVFDFFYTTAQGNGALAEFGVFLAGTSTANTGSLLSHVLISENKTSAETLTVESTITIG